MSRIRLLFTSLAVLVLSSGCQAIANEPDAAPAERVVDATSTAEDALIEGADPGLIDQGAWWSWAGSEPFGSGPVEDETGDACEANQGGEVWFLAGTFGGHVDRTCTVPEGMPLVFPIVNTAGGEGCCDGFLEDASATATLDGEALRVHEVPVEVFAVDLVDGNAMFGDGGRFSVNGCGLWVALEGLSAGEHLIEFEGTSGGFATSATYVLMVALPASRRQGRSAPSPACGTRPCIIGPCGRLAGAPHNGSLPKRAEWSATMTPVAPEVDRERVPCHAAHREGRVAPDLDPVDPSCRLAPGRSVRLRSNGVAASGEHRLLQLITAVHGLVDTRTGRHIGRGGPGNAVSLDWESRSSRLTQRPVPRDQGPPRPGLLPAATDCGAGWLLQEGAGRGIRDQPPRHLPSLGGLSTDKARALPWNSSERSTGFRYREWVRLRRQIE